MLKRLEDGINRMIERHDLLEAENKGLQDALGLKELEIRELKKKLQRLDGEKGLARDKVESLLRRLNGLITGA
ncbi:MAG: hypothetical protein ACE5EB_02650 [Thermodesulfobacteriota bacterium]